MTALEAAAMAAKKPDISRLHGLIKTAAERGNCSLPLGTLLSRPELDALEAEGYKITGGQQAGGFTIRW